jgi:peptide/nickel transport system permease protein
MDNLITGISFIGYSMPIFFIALVSMYIFSVNFKRWGLPYLPTVGMFDPQVGKTASEVLRHLILPVFSISFISLAAYSRYIRGTMLEVLNQDYIRTAKSKGIPRRDIIFVHALKNASLPIVTIIGLDLPLLLAGAVVTERIFAWPGMGRLFLDHLTRSDTPVVMGILLLISVAVVVFQILTDITYAWLDPRITYK